jgi:hypothetical protein
MQALTDCDAKVISTRTTAGQCKRPVQGGNGGNVWEGSKCKHLHPVMSTRTATFSSRVSSKGQWMKVQGKFKMQAHKKSGVVMDIAAFKISHSVGIDIDATALRATRARSSSKGAMEEMSGKVQNASTHRLGRINHEHVHSSRSVQGSQFKVAMERFICGFDWHENSRCPAKTKELGVSNSVGQWMKVQGKFKMQAHITSGVVMDIAAFKVSHCVGSDIDATTLQAEKARSASIGAPNPNPNPNQGQWRKCHRRFKMRALTPFHCAHTSHTVNSAGQWMKCLGRFKIQALTSCDEHAHSNRLVQGSVQGGNG